MKVIFLDHDGVIKIYDPTDPETDLSKKAFELIAYSSVDRALCQ